MDLIVMRYCSWDCGHCPSGMYLYVFVILWMIYQSFQHALQRHPQEVALAVAAMVG